MRFKVFLCVRAYKCTYVRRKMNKFALYINGIYESGNVPDISEFFRGGCSILYTGFCRFTRNSSCPGISPQRCFAHIIAKSYHFRTVIQLSRCTRENIPQGVTFKTPIFVGFFKTFLFSFKLHNKKSRHIDSTNSGRTFLPLAQFVLKLCNGLNFKL